MNEQMYRRSMGYPYDDDALEREVSDGFGPSEETNYDSEPDDSDLMPIAVIGTDNDVRLQEIEFELSQQLTTEERVELEAEKVVRLEQRRLEELTNEHPQYASALRAWLLSEVSHLAEAKDAIDDEMILEAEILDQIIAEVYDEDEALPLIKIAETMKALIEAERNYSEICRQSEITLVQS